MKDLHRLFIASMALFYAPVCVFGNTQPTAFSPVDLSTHRMVGSEQYRFATEYLGYAPDGSMISHENTIVEVTIQMDGNGQQTLVCNRFQMTDKEGVTLEIPGLQGWKNVMDGTATEVLGIPHSDFSGLKNSEGQSLSPELEYRVYNTFVDFYAFNNIFAEGSEAGKSIHDLKEIGQLIEHYSAFSKPSVSLGDSVKDGSYFENGRVTLEWKGMSKVAGNDCALVAFDSGESSFRMIMEPAPGMNLDVKGGSHYWGELYINCENLWLEKANFKEIVLTQMVFAENPPMNAVIKRMGVIERL